MNVRAYSQAQKAIAALKGAVLTVVAEAGSEGIRNSEVGRMLGIYGGHEGHEGHIPRTILAQLQAEGAVVQDATNKRWYVCEKERIPDR